MPRGIYNHTKSGPRNQFCPKGHDTLVCGRTKSYTCILCTRECQKNYASENKEYYTSYEKEYRETEQRKKYLEHYRRDHPEMSKLSNLKMATNRNLRVVSWGQDKIKEFYKNCPKGMEIDHIIPLQGKKVSGLHVRWNLQYLDSHENYVKHSKCNLTDASDWYGEILKQAGLK